MTHAPKRRPTTIAEPQPTTGHTVTLDYRGGDAWGVLRGAAIDRHALEKLGYGCNDDVRVVILEKSR